MTTSTSDDQSSSMTLFIEQANHRGFKTVNRVLSDIQYQIKRAQVLLSDTLRLSRDFYLDSTKIQVQRDGDATSWKLLTNDVNEVHFRQSMYIEIALSYIYVSYDYFATLVDEIAFGGSSPADVLSFRHVANRTQREYRNTPLDVALRSVLADPDYKYLNAVVNTLKHRRIVPTWSTLLADADITEDSVLATIDPFEYKGERYLAFECPRQAVKLGMTVNNQHIPMLCVALSAQFFQNVE